MLVGFFPESLDQDPPSAVADGEEILDEEDRIDQILQPGLKDRPSEQGGTRYRAQGMQGSGESQRARLELAQRLFMRALDVAPGYSAASMSYNGLLEATRSVVSGSRNTSSRLLARLLKIQSLSCRICLWAQY